MAIIVAFALVGLYLTYVGGSPHRADLDTSGKLNPDVFRRGRVTRASSPGLSSAFSWAISA
jgi:hypothetical protein